MRMLYVSIQINPILTTDFFVGFSLFKDNNSRRININSNMSNNTTQYSLARDIEIKYSYIFHFNNNM